MLTSRNTGAPEKMDFPTFYGNEDFGRFRNHTLARGPSDERLVLPAITNCTFAGGFQSEHKSVEAYRESQPKREGADTPCFSKQPEINFAESADTLDTSGSQTKRFDQLLRRMQSQPELSAAQ